MKAQVEPVLKRADSVKQLVMLDDALSVADKYVDKYLPDKDPAEDVADKPGKCADRRIGINLHITGTVRGELGRCAVAQRHLREDDLKTV